MYEDRRYWNRTEPTIKLVLRDYNGPYDAFELDNIWDYRIMDHMEPVEDEE